MCTRCVHPRLLPCCASLLPSLACLMPLCLTFVPRPVFLPSPSPPAWRQVIMATNRADTLDPALLRPGRLDRKIEFPLPDRRQKRLVFQVREWMDGWMGGWGALLGGRARDGAVCVAVAEWAVEWADACLPSCLPLSSAPPFAFPRVPLPTVPPHVPLYCRPAPLP